jgi:ABC-type lipoprotein export system ATPase subunit
MPLLALDHITKTFQLGTVAFTAVNDVSLAVEPGEFVAIMGHSGSGKSTLMNIIGLLDRPTSGEYRFNGNLMSLSMGDRDLARMRSESIGFIFQTFNLLPNLDVVANVELPAAYMRSHSMRAHKKALDLL